MPTELTCECAQRTTSAWAPTKQAVTVVVPSWSSVHLDAVRGIAALTVMAFHYRGFFFSSFSQIAQSGTPQVTHDRANIGNTAVLIFFVLSGYLVGGSVIKGLRRHRWSTKDYLIKRLTRLWVVLIPAVLIGLTLDAVRVHFFGDASLTHRDFAVSTVLGNLVFLQGLFIGTPGSNTALWSLTNEFWYYILFPLMVVPWVLRSSAWVKVAAIVFVAAFLAFTVHHTSVSALNHIAVLFPIWLFGALVALLPSRDFGRAKVPVTVGLIVAMVAVTLITSRINGHVHAFQYGSSLLFLALLYMLLQYPAEAGAGVYKMAAGFFSRISYSLYLLHLPLGLLLGALLLGGGHARPRTFGNFLLFAAFSGLAILITYGFYLLFESNTERIRRFVFREVQSHQQLSSSAPEVSGA